jgi:hypothetical protein
MLGCCLVLLALVTGVAASRPQPAVDFSGRWTLDAPAVATTPAVPGTPASAAAAGDMGSGWGSPITIVQDARQMSVEYVAYSRYDLQPPMRFVYPLDGSEGRNTVSIGRGEQVESVRARWDGNALIVVTASTVTDRNVAKPFTVEVTRRLSLEAPTMLIVEVTRGGVLGGPASTTRSVYRKSQP